jgi:hypothetical protein
MKAMKTVGIVALVVGIVLLILSLAANPLGIGNPSVFGRNQIIGTILGAVAIVAGLILTLKK